MDKKKLLLILLIVIFVALLSVGSVFAYENKYLWIPISENELRQKVSDFYYFEIENESCVLNNYYNFKSKEDCQSTVKCVSDKLSNIIPGHDLRKLVNSMKQGKYAESGVISYFQQNSDLELQHKGNSQDCLK